MEKLLTDDEWKNLSAETRHKLNLMYIELCELRKACEEMADQLEVDNPNCTSLSKYFDVINKPIPYEVYKNFEQGQPFKDER